MEVHETERERDRDRDRETQTERETERDRERQRQREREKTQTGTDSSNLAPKFSLSRKSPHHQHHSCAHKLLRVPVMKRAARSQVACFST